MLTHTTVHTNDIASPDFEAVDFARRFGGIARLYGAAALEHFRSARVCVIGVGGVGSWIVEALARSAIGHLTLIDLDNVAESNINRQIQAMSDTIGQAKITALAERIAQINPFCQVAQVEDFITPDNLPQMLGGQRFDYIIDAIDNTRAKAALVAYCRANGLPLLMIGSAGGQTDPTQIAVRDLSKTEQEPLLKRVRKLLRSDYGFPRGMKNKFHVDAVFSMETLKFPDQPEGAACAVDGSGVTGLNCAGFGSSVVVTASFGMVAAAHVLRKLADAATAVPAVTAAATADLVCDTETEAEAA
jgi:tRNA A37 threonylcarbamoyladenosine dehydratase